MALGEMGRVTRPTNMANQLAQRGDLTVLASATANNNWLPIGAHHVILHPRDRSYHNQLRRAGRLLTLKFEEEIWDNSLTISRKALATQFFDFIFCEDITLLPLAISLRDRSLNGRRAKIIMDAREFYPRQFEHKTTWRVFLSRFNDYLCRTYLPRSDYIFTVSKGLQDAYKKYYNVTCDLLPSYTPHHDISPCKTRENIKLIHHGIAIPGRKIERMIETVKYLDERFSLDLMLMPYDKKYIHKLYRVATNTPRVRIIPPVPMPNIVSFISNYDMGLCIFEPTTFNLRHCLPNKFFEFLQARLGIAIGPSPDMAHVVDTYGLGVVADDFNPKTMATRLNSLTTTDVDAFKAAANLAARDMCWERNMQVIATLLGQS